MSDHPDPISRRHFLAETVHGGAGMAIDLPLALLATSLLAGFCLASAEPSEGQTDRQKAAEALLQGRRYLEQAKYGEAIEAFTAAIKSDRGSIEAHEGRAEAYAARGEFGASQDDRETAARLRLAGQIQRQAPFALARSAEFWIKFLAIGGAALVVVWLCIRRFNILFGAKAPEWDMQDRPHWRDASRDEPRSTTDQSRRVPR